MAGAQAIGTPTTLHRTFASKASLSFKNSQFLTIWRCLPGTSLNISQLRTAPTRLRVAQQKTIFGCYVLPHTGESISEKDVPLLSIIRFKSRST